MAKGEYAIQISAKVQQAIDNLQDVQKQLKGVGGAVKQADTQVKGLSVQFLAFGATLVSTTTSIAFIGAAVEKAMFKSGLAIQRVGADAERLATSLQAAGRSAAELLPVGAAFAQVGFAGEDLQRATEISFQFSRVMGMSAKQAGAALSEIAAAAGIRTPEGLRRLASGLDAVNKMFPDFSKGNTEMLRTLAPTAVQMGVTAASLSAANVAFQRAGVSAGDARAAIGEMLENFRYGPEQITAFATALGLPQSEMARFRALDPSAQFREMFSVMQEGGFLIRENVPALMSYLGVSRETADAMVRMAQSGEDMNAIFGPINDEFAKGTFLQKDFAKWTKTLYGALDQLWQTLRGLAEETAPWIAMIGTFLIKALTGLVKILGIIPAPIRAVAVAFIGLSGAVMLTSKFLKSNLVTSFGEAMASVANFTKSVVVATWEIVSMTAKAVAMRVGQNVLALLEGGWIALKWAVTGAGTALKVAAQASWATLKAFGALGVGTAKLGGRLLLFAGKAVAAAISALGSLFASAMTFVATAVPAMVSGLGAIAAAAWTAIAPLLPFIAIGALVVAAAAAIGYALYKVVQFIVQNWIPIWEGVTSIAYGFWDALKAGWGVIVDVSTAIWDGLIGGLKTLWGWLVSAGEAIAAPFVWLYDKITAVGDAIGGVIGWLFGSSLFHLKEGVAEVMPALSKMEGAFTGIGRAAGRIGLESHIPDDIRVRVAEPAAAAAGRGRTGGLSEDLDGKQAFGGPAGSGPTGGISTPPANLGAAGAGEGTPTTIRVVIPVTMTLDGEVVGRANAEYDIDLGRERFMNASLEPMRGTGR